MHEDISSFSLTFNQIIQQCHDILSETYTDVPYDYLMANEYCI
jgi:hypothetical protein